ncbi:MAG TPA: YlxR family protein [Nocardioides sp.]|nr:YlxR family protein [Nocardioides sp.]
MARRRQFPARTDETLETGPVRTCIGCRTRAAKRELLRVTVGSDPRTGTPVVVPDPEATAPGRGAHLHPTSACYDLAVRRKAFARALRFTGAAGGLSSAPVGEYLRDSHQTDTTGSRPGAGPTETGAPRS